MIVSNNHGLWIAKLEAAGVKILTHEKWQGDLVVADGRLFLLRVETEPRGNGNLTCLNLRIFK